MEGAAFGFVLVSLRFSPAHPQGTHGEAELRMGACSPGRPSARLLCPYLCIRGSKWSAGTS